MTQNATRTLVEVYDSYREEALKKGYRATDAALYASAQTTLDIADRHYAEGQISEDGHSRQYKRNEALLVALRREYETEQGEEQP